MRTLVITAPAPVVTFADASLHLKNPPAVEQPLVEGYIAAATANLDGPSGWLGRAIGLQTLETRFDAFDSCAPLVLPFPPAISVTSVSYLDANGATQTLATTGYELMGQGLVPAFNAVWPDTLFRAEAVRVRYQAGYVADPIASPLVPALPPAIRAAILLMVADLYENRGEVVEGRTEAAPMALNVRALLEPFRVYR